MTYEVELGAVSPRLSADQVAELERLLLGIAGGYGSSVAERGLHDLDVRVTAVVADDFARAVQEHSYPGGSNDGYVAERLAGFAAGKNLPQDESWTKVVIVFSTVLWESEDPALRAERLMLLAHELAHPLFGNLYARSGLTKDWLSPSQTPAELSRSMARILFEEYGVDRLADAIVGGMVKLSDQPDGPTRAARVWDLTGARAVTSATTVLIDARDNWAAIVQRYREHQLELGEMWGRLISAFDNATTTLVHCQSAADAAGVDLAEALARVVTPTDKLLMDTWPAFAEVLRAQPILPKLDDLAAAHTAVIEAGDLMFREVLRRLGIQADDLPDRRCYLHVGEPLI